MKNRLLVLSIIVLQFGLFLYELIAQYDSTRMRIALSLTNAVSVASYFLVNRLLRRKFDITLHPIVLVVIAASVWLDAAGNFLHLYGRFWWWDHLTHAVGGLALTVGFFALISITLLRRIPALSWWTASIFAFCVAQTVAAVYEASEWLGDILLKTHRVQGPFDTPRDIFFNVLGGVVTVGVAWLWNRWRKRPHA